jgi:hypothetical protein
MDPHYLSGELARAARFEYIRPSKGDKNNYKGVPQVDMSMLKTIDKFHAQPANSVDHSHYVRYPAENPQDFLEGVPIYNVKQTETIYASNANDPLFMNAFVKPLDREQVPKQSIVGQTLLE